MCTEIIKNERSNLIIWYYKLDYKQFENFFLTNCITDKVILIKVLNTQSGQTKPDRKIKTTVLCEKFDFVLTNNVFL